MKRLWDSLFVNVMRGACAALLICGQAVASPTQVLFSEPILPIPFNHNVNPDRAALGEKLFHDPLLSADQTISCATCHNIEHFGVDGGVVSVGINGQRGRLNAPTVMNSRFNFVQFWDGRARNLREQAAGPLTNKTEMGASWALIISRLNQNETYRQTFDALYPKEGISAHTISDAITTYEYTLNTVHSSFDRYLRGNVNAINAQQKRGYDLFKSYGCISCHQGVNVGGNMFQRMGTFKPFFTTQNTPSKEDFGRFNVTGRPEDKHVFKVPSLRLAAHTAPYFHDGRTETLAEAIEIMATFQIGVSLPEQDIKDIEAFIQSLSGTYIKGHP